MCSPISESEVVGEHESKKAAQQPASETDQTKLDTYLSHLPTAPKDAIQGLRTLTKKSSINRDYIAQKGAIPAVIGLLQTSPDPETQKHAVTLLFNLSLTSHLKKTLLASGAVEPIVEVLKHGDDEARENAAAALFTLSSKGAHAELIGATDAIPALAQLLIDGTRRGKLDAMMAIFDLCIAKENKARAVEAGVIPCLVRLLTQPGLGLEDQSLATLALLAVHERGQREIARVSAALPILVDIVAESGNAQNRENAVCVLLEVCKNDVNCVYNAAKLGLCGALGELASTGTAKARRKARRLLEVLRHGQHRTGHPGARSI